MNDLRATVVGFILDGNIRRDIVEWIQANHKNCKDPAKEFDSAVSSIRKRHKELEGSYYEFCLVSLRELYRRSVEIGEYKTAAGILKDIDKLAARREPSDMFSMLS